MSSDIIRAIKEESAPNLLPSVIQWGRPLGNGSFGSVNEVKIQQRLALKQIDLKNLCDTNNEAQLESALKEAHNEYRIMNKNLPNVVRSHQFYFDEKKKQFMFTMDYMEGGDLESHIEHGPMTFRDFYKVFVDVATGLYSLLSEEKVVHQDLKPENILLDKAGKAYVADVGIAKRFESTKNMNAMKTITLAQGTTRWMAPEMLQAINNNGNNDEKSRTNFAKLDVFSLGLMALYAMDRDSYNEKRNVLNTDEKILKDYIKEFEKRNTIYDKEFLVLLRRMLTFEVENRPDIDELYEWVIHRTCHEKVKFWKEKIKKLEAKMQKDVAELSKEKDSDVANAKNEKIVEEKNKIEEIPKMEKASSSVSGSGSMSVSQNQIFNQSGLMFDIEKLRLAGQAGLVNSFMIDALINNQNNQNNQPKPAEPKIKKPAVEKKNNEDKPKSKDKKPQDNKKMNKLEKEVLDLINDIDKREKPSMVTDLDIEIPFEKFTTKIKKKIEKHKNLVFLSINDCELKALKNFPKLPHLKQLELCDNNLIGKTLGNLKNLNKLESLLIGGNRIKTVEDLSTLAQLPRLVDLELTDCPVCDIPDYRRKVFKAIPSLEYLDEMDKKGKKFTYEVTETDDEYSDYDSDNLSDGSDSEEEETSSEEDESSSDEEIILALKKKKKTKKREKRARVKKEKANKYGNKVVKKVKK